jgi:alkanesulfonate monooxygenase SsuD/methylene tetrahydromethanopterin reductase-like flavin-dependent oxidoreductase (luciferase family)
MKFMGLDLVANSPDAAGQPGDPTRRLSETVQNAVLFEELGFDGFAVGERHHVPFLSSAPPVVLSHIAAVTSRIRLFTGVTLLSVLDPVRVAEDYATLDHLSGGRVELIIGKGNGPEQAELFGIGRLEAWDTIAENYRLLRQLWSGHKVTWTPPAGVPSIRKTPLTDAGVHPQPLQPKIRIWHGSATAERSVELAAEFGDPVFSANGMNPVTRYAELIRDYRDRWAGHGRDPGRRPGGRGTRADLRDPPFPGRRGRLPARIRTVRGHGGQIRPAARHVHRLRQLRRLPRTRLGAGGQPAAGDRQGRPLP